MHKHIVAGITLDEPVALLCVKPLNRTLFSHISSLLSSDENPVALNEEKTFIRFIADVSGCSNN
jgi:hypothetical protein